MDTKQIINRLKAASSQKNREGMARFGINTEIAFGTPMPSIRKLAKEIGKNHELAEELWKAKIHETRILACLIDEPAKVSEKQITVWANDFNSWDLCDQCCMNLFDKTPFAYELAIEFAKNEKEFVRRAGFAIIASLAVHDKKADDKKFIQFLPLIKKYSTDERNFVRKAVNWALRQIGKRNPNLKEEAIKLAEGIQKIDSKSAKWIASDALRELRSRK
jgi:3-methyladenine DNA glycosylase AlkD